MGKIILRAFLALCAVALFVVFFMRERVHRPGLGTTISVLLLISTVWLLVIEVSEWRAKRSTDRSERIDIGESQDI